MINEQKKLHNDLTLFLGIISLLICIGLLFIYSASSVYALERCGTAHYFVKKQAVGLILGLLSLLIIRLLPLTLIKKLTPLFLLFSMACTALTLFPGFSTTIHGSSRWLTLPGITFQPSELLKISFIMFIAWIFSTKKNQSHSSLMILFFLLLLLGIIGVILLKQPDFGMAVTITITTFILLFIMHIPSIYLLVASGGALIIAALLIYMRSYRWKRIITFFNPWNARQGSGFQLIQSLIAIGSGRWFGVGISHSKQKFFYLPMQHTDFIFSIITEETGFMGALVLIMLYLLFMYVGMRIALHMHDLFSVLVTLGFVIMTSLQALINIAVTTGLLPTKGIGLPFVSYGNSALIASLCMVGLIMNCVAQERKYYYE